jgi:hypothetical protein
VLLAVLMSSTFLCVCDCAAQEMGGSEAAPSTPASATQTAHAANSNESAAGWHARQGSFYKRTWGVDILGVKSVSSGYMLRFSYRILDVDKSKAFNDKKAKPYLVNEDTGEKLFIPEMEKVGQLRQTAPPQSGRIYWMVFANPNKSLKAGNHVDVVIGKVRVDGMVIE